MLGRWQLFFPQPPPPGYPKGRRNRCQDDSLLLAREHPELTLVAGYLQREGEGLWWGHFWCVNEDGRLIDTAPLAFGDGEPPELYVGFSGRYGRGRAGRCRQPPPLVEALCQTPAL